MTGRLWYPQLDIYDAIRRMGGLLGLWKPDSHPSIERFYIADFYLANPPLLHKTNMSQHVRKEFYGLSVPKPEKTFMSYPSAPLLFEKMAEVQRQAFRTISGKGLIDLEVLENGAVRPSAQGVDVFEDQFIGLLALDEKRVAEFLVSSFADNEVDIVVLRRSTGLRRATR